MDDAFERLLLREEEIRRRVERGDITDEEAAALRDLLNEGEAGDDGPGRLRVTVEQLGRIVDEGVDAEALRALLDLAPDLGIDEAIDLVAESAPSARDLDHLRRISVGPLGRDRLAALFDNAVEPAAVEAAARYGCADPVGVAIGLTERGADVADLLHQLRRAGVDDLDGDELEAIADNGVEPRALARMIEAGPDLPFETVIELCVEDVDPDAVRRMRAEGIDIDPRNLTGSAASVGMNVQLGNRRLLVGAGRERIRRSGAVTGLYIGDVTIDPGVTVDFAAILIGNLRIGVGAEVSVTGRVTGTIVRDEQADTTAASL